MSHLKKGQLVRYQCNFCPKTFCNTTEYYKHANRIHSEDVSARWFSCNICSTYYPSQSTLQNHKNQGHQQKMTLGERVTCKYCSSTFYNFHVFYKHANTKHQEEVSADWYLCEDCQQYFPTQVTLQKHSDQAHNHRKYESQEVRCSFCTDKFQTLSQFYVHANKKHLDEVSDRWHCCPLCSTFLPTEIALRQHKEEVHSQKRSPGNVECKYCTSEFSKPQLFYKHANKCHRDLLELDGWFSCRHCSSYFPTMVALTMHSVIHKPDREMKVNQNKKKIQCGFCINTYCDTTQYYRHANKEHLDDLLMEDWDQCDVCLNYFPNETVLSLHQRQAHSIIRPKVIQNTWKPEVKVHMRLNNVILPKSQPQSYSIINRANQNYLSDEDMIDPEMLCPSVELIEGEADENFLDDDEAEQNLYEEGAGDPLAI